MEVSPELSVRRGREAVEFYKAAFGAVEVYRVGGTEENEDVVSQLSVGSTSFWVSDESPEHENFSPESLGGSTVRLLLVVDDRRAGRGAGSEGSRARDRGARLVAGADRGSFRASLGDRKAAGPMASGRLLTWCIRCGRGRGP